jgi:transposase
MSQSFLPCDREQVYLLPSSLEDWLPEEHLARTVLGAVEELDLVDFCRSYRVDGHGRAAA